VFKYLSEADGTLMLTDNRLDEWFSGLAEQMEAAEGAPLLCPDETMQVASPPCEIEVRDLCFSYMKGRPVLKNINLKFEAGAKYLLRGPNGIGKTTLSKILCGIIKPTSGEIRVNGRAVQPWRKPGLFTSYAFQDPDLQLFATTVREQLANSKWYSAAIRWYGLEKFSDQHPLDLPYVLKKRLTIAGALAREPHFTILDEPTIGQDRRSALDSRSFRSRDAGIIISHSKVYADEKICEL
jgi:ABC-type multidrug transport system ATPase subunit